MFYNAKNKGTGFDLESLSFTEGKYTFNENIVYHTVLTDHIPLFSCPIDNKVKGDPGLPGEDGAAGQDGNDGADGADAPAPMGVIGPAPQEIISFDWKPQVTPQAIKEHDFATNWAGNMEYYVLESPSNGYGTVPMFGVKDTVQPFAFDFSFVFEHADYKNYPDHVVAKYGNALYIGSSAIILWEQNGASIPVSGPRPGGGIVYIVLDSTTLLSLGPITADSPKKGLAVIGTDYDNTENTYLNQSLYKFRYSANSGQWYKDTSTTTTMGADYLCHSAHGSKDYNTVVYTTNYAGKVTQAPDGSQYDLVDTVRQEPGTGIFTVQTTGYYHFDGATSAEDIGNYIIGETSRFSISDAANG